MNPKTSHSVSSSSPSRFGKTPDGRARAALLGVVVSLWLSACGGGGGDDGATPPASMAPASATPSLSDCTSPLLGRPMLFSSGSGGASVERVAQMEADSPPKLLVTTTSPGRKDSGMRHFYDPDGGLLRPTGHARFASGGNASAAASLDSAIIENVPDLRGLAVGASQTYQKKVLSPASSPPGLRHTTNIRETATFLGHQKVTTPAGTFDACKVRFVETDLDAGPDASSTERIYYFVPNLHWVRFESLNYVEELLSVAP